MARIEMLKDSEPYFKGDIVDVADDRVEYLEDQGIAKAVKSDVPLFSKGVELTQDGVSIQDKEYGKRMAEGGPEEKKKIASERAESSVEQTTRSSGRKATDGKPEVAGKGSKKE